MAQVEKWLKRLLLAALFNTAIWFSGAGCLLQVVLVVSIIGVPLALFLTASPTILLYMLIGLPLWLVFRRRGVEMAIAAAAVPMLAVAVLVPLWANRRVEAEANELIGRDHGRPVLLPKGRAVALLEPGDARRKGVCEEMCQRLLFSGTARMVLVGEPAVLAGPAPLTAWYIAPRRGPCRPPALPNVLAERKDLGIDDLVGLRRPVLSSRLAAVYGDDHCLFAEPRPIGDADILLVNEQFNWLLQPPSGGAFDVRLVRVDPANRYRILIRKQDGRTEVLRRSLGTAYPLAGLLALSPPGGDDGGSWPGHWMRDARRLGDWERFSLFAYVRNDLSVGGLVDYQGKVYRPEAAARLTAAD